MRVLCVRLCGCIVLWRLMSSEVACCSVVCGTLVTPCLLEESTCLVLPMCILISGSSVLCVLMALSMFMFVKVMSSLISVMNPPACLCSLYVRIVV